MLEEQLTKTLTGLAIIIPAIILLRWFLTRKAGSPEEWGERQIEELKQRLSRGDIDQQTFEQRVRDIRDS
jgi:uncharacterized membrane protein